MTTVKSTSPTTTTTVKSTSPTTMTSVKSTSPTTMTTIKSKSKTVKSKVEMNHVDVEDQIKTKINRWTPKFQKKTTPRKLEDDSSNSNSYYPVLRNNPGKHYLSHHLPPQPLAG